MEGSTELQRPQQEKLMPVSQSLKSAEAGWLRGIKNRFNQAIGIEQKSTEPFPQVSVDIFFSGHGTRKDWDGLAEKFEKADVFIPETVGWDSKILESTRDISEGKINVSFASPSTRRLKEMIYQSSKPIAFIDVPFSHPLTKKLKEIIRNKALPLIGSLPKFLHTIDADEKEFVRLQKKREEYMISHLKPAIEELLQTYPYLKQKKSINVLLTLGAVHTPVYVRLKKLTAIQKLLDPLAWFL